MAEYKRHFSVDEARAMLPDIRSRFADIHALIKRIRETQIGAAEARLKILSGNGHGPILISPSKFIEQVQVHIDWIVGEGVSIKDLERGLIDFPHFLPDRRDHEVFLCYEISEDDIYFWHEIEEGFAGRTPL